MSVAETPTGATIVDYFDHNGPEYVRERYGWYREIMRDKGPVFWSPHYGGYWVAIGYDELMEAAKDWETFSSLRVLEEPKPGEIAYKGLFVPPRDKHQPMLEDDPPEWEKWREVLAPLFSIPAVKGWRGRIQTLADACLDRSIETGRIDFAHELTNIVPAIFSMEFVGIPTETYAEVAENHHKASHLQADDPRRQVALDGLAGERRLVAETIEARKTDRRSGVISALLNARDRGHAFTDEDIAKLGGLVIGAGIDTTSAVLGTALIVLTQRPDLRQRLKDDPSLTAQAFEEFMRYSAPTQGLCRTVTRDTELGGQKLRRGDRIMLCFAAACRDERQFPSPEVIDLDRRPNLHAAFGAGVHRCIGSMFARLEFETLINTILRRMPDYQVDLDAVRSFENVGVVAGYTTIPATFTPGPRLGVDPGIEGWPLKV